MAVPRELPDQGPAEKAGTSGHENLCIDFSFWHDCVVPRIRKNWQRTELPERKPRNTLAR